LLISRLRVLKKKRKKKKKKMMMMMMKKKVFPARWFARRHMSTFEGKLTPQLSRGS